MKQQPVFTMNGTDKKMEDLLAKLGMNRIEAKCLIFLIDLNKGKSSDIEKIMNLRQPEVSIAIQHLIEKGIANMTTEKKPNKGRPIHIYSLAKTKRQIYDLICKQTRKEIDDKIKVLNELDSLFL